MRLIKLRVMLTLGLFAALLAVAGGGPLMIFGSTQWVLDFIEHDLGLAVPGRWRLEVAAALAPDGGGRQTSSRTLVFCQTHTPEHNVAVETGYELHLQALVPGLAGTGSNRRHQRFSEQGGAQ